MNRILPIVEGHGDLKAVPPLLRALLNHHELYDVQVLAPHKRGELPKITARFDDYFKIALKEEAAILWVLDFDCADCICPVTEATKLYERANMLRPGWPFKLAFVVKEFESLFLAEVAAAKHVLGIDEALTFPLNPEGIRDAKGWLSRALPKGVAYKETVHQEKIAAQLDFHVLRARSDSFEHLERSLLYLVDSAPP